MRISNSREIWRHNPHKPKKTRLGSKDCRPIQSESQSMKRECKDPPTNLQEQETYLGVVEGKALPSAPPPRGAAEGRNALLYLNGHNSDKRRREKTDNASQPKVWSPKSKTAKKQKTLTGNVQYWADKFGVETLGFLTLTFKENLRDRREAQRRWDNLNRTIRRDGKFSVLVKVLEVQKRGAIHYHLLVRLQEDIRTGFDWEAFKRAGEAYQAKDREEGKKQTKIYASSAKSHLRHLWGYMRTKCKSHGFGRSELMPIEYPNNIGSYLGKYLNKDDQGRENGNWANVEMTKGMRRVSYGQKEIKTHSANFDWVKHPTGKPIWRHKLKEWAEYRGFRDLDEIRKDFGKNWSHHNFSEIMHVDMPRVMRESMGLPPLSETWGKREPNLTTAVSPETWAEFFQDKGWRRSSFEAHRRHKEAWDYKQKYPWKFDEGV